MFQIFCNNPHCLVGSNGGVLELEDMGCFTPCPECDIVNIPEDDIGFLIICDKNGVSVLISGAGNFEHIAQKLLEENPLLKNCPRELISWYKQSSSLELFERKDFKA